MPYYRSGVCHGTCLRTCRANPSAPAPPLRSGSSVRRRMAVILEPTVLAAALITSRRYALSRHLLTHVPRQGSALRSFVAVGSAPA